MAQCSRQQPLCALVLLSIFAAFAACAEGPDVLPVHKYLIRSGPKASAVNLVTDADAGSLKLMLKRWTSSLRWHPTFRMTLTFLKRT